MTDSNACPLVSVIVPIYKAEKYLDMCVESIVRQTLHNIEIILVDDIITTGLTLQEAKRSIEEAGGRVLMAFVLSDAST